MSLIERLKKAFSNKPYLAALSRGSSGIDVAKPAFSHLLGIKSYNSWVYAAATMNAVACASTPLRLYAKSGNSVRKLWNTREPSKAQRRFLSGDSRCQPSPTAMRKVVEFGDDWVEVTDDHPLLRLFSRANPYLNGFDATVLRIIHGELTGNAYIHPVIDRALGVPTELWLMPPQWVTIVPDKELFIKGYKYGASEATQVDLKPDEVIHFKRPHPNDMYYGMGKVEGAWGSVQANNALHEMDHAMFKNRARPDYVGVVKGDPSDEELDRLEVAIKETLRGTDKVGKFILTSADLTLQPMSFPPKDLTGRDEIVEEIAAIFGVPVSMLKTNDPNLASATTGFAQWREGTIAPLLRMDEETLNQRLLPLFGIEGEAVLAYDDPVRSNEQFELTSRSASVAGGWRTPNEARTEEGLEPLDTPYANELKGAAPAAQGQPMPSVGGGVAPAPPAVIPTASTAAPVAASLTPAQTSSLVELAVKATDGTLSLATARAIAAAAFPDIAPMVIASIFDGVAVKSPAQVADEASKKNCGVGSGGFEAGNDCGAGDGSGGSGSGVSPDKLIADTRNAKVEENGDILVDVGSQNQDIVTSDVQLIASAWQGKDVEKDATRALAAEVLGFVKISDTYVQSAEAYCLERTGEDILQMQSAARNGKTVESVIRERVLWFERRNDPALNSEQVETKVAQLVTEFNAKRDSIVSDAKTSLPRKMVVHRGFSINGEETKKWLGAAKAGDSVEMGVMSTSQNPKVAATYGGVGVNRNGSVLLKITTSRGMVGQTSERVDAAESGNQEIVIAPKSIKIKSIQKIKTRQNLGDATPLETTSYMIDCEAVY